MDVTSYRFIYVAPLTIKLRLSILNPNLACYLALVLIGLANALPIPLMGSTLSIWLLETGFNKASIGLFSLASVPFSLKFLWIPIIESGGQRKSWACVTLALIAIALLGISLLDLADSPTPLAAIIFLLSLGAGAFYAVGLSYEMECLDASLYSLGSSCIITGYRVGLIIAGAGALYLSLMLGWTATYQLFACLITMMAGYIYWLPEPFKSKSIREERRKRINKYSSKFYGLYQEMLIKPCSSFFEKNDWKLIVFLIIFFKTGNQLMKSMEGPFYFSLGLSKSEIATFVKLWGVISTVLGSTLAGLYFKGKDHYVALKLVSWINILSLCCFFILSLTGKSHLLYLAIAVEHLVGGLSMTTFIFFLWRVCDKRFAAMQYAMLWSIYLVKGDLLGCSGGLLASIINWPCFFLIAILVSIFSSLIISSHLKRTELKSVLSSS